MTNLVQDARYAWCKCARPGNILLGGRADDWRWIAGEHATRLSRDESRSNENAARRIVGSLLRPG